MNHPSDATALAALAAAAVDLPPAVSPEDAAVRVALLAARAAAVNAALAAAAAGCDPRWQAAWLRVRIAELPVQYWRAVS